MKSAKSVSRKHIVVKAWGGFCMDKLDWIEVDAGWGGPGDCVLVPAIFETHHVAMERYEDVRRVEIREVKARRK